MINLLASQPEIGESISVVIALTPAAGHITGNLSYFKLVVNPWILKLGRLSGTTVVGDYPISTFYAKLVTAFPRIFAWFGRGRYDYTIHNDNPEYMSVYLHKMSGGTSFKNTELLR
jgi:hypothetical protein